MSKLNSRREEFFKLWKLALPIAIAHAGQALMGFVDTAVVGRTGTDALAAVGLSTAIFFAVSSFASGLLMGVDPLLTQNVGAGNLSRARVIFWQGSYLAIAVGVILAVPLMLLPTVLASLGVDFAELPLVHDYLLWRAPSLPLLLLFMVARSYLQAVGRTGALVVATVAANIFNLGANLLLVFGGAELPAAFGPLREIPALGVTGSALSTLLCCVLQSAIVAWAVRRVDVPGGKPSSKLVREDVLQALRVGFPIGLHIAAEVGIFSLAGVLARGLGAESMSAHQIAITYASISFTVALGIGNAGCVRVGWAVGAFNTQQARQSGFMAFASGTAFMSLCALVFAFFPLPLALFVGAPREVLPLVLPLLMVSAVFQISDGLQAVGAGVLRGVGETRFPLVANMVGHYLVGLPVALLLGFRMGYGVLGIWWGLCIGLTAVAVTLFWRFERLSAGTLRPLNT
ncbi:MATE family efflux transporter [Melittangium boletus]|uniref:Multidrug-efflux transporter n=1 Tax=Melittangium boletus DSM 14713 TaxID=1294270 RepID=A0A250IAW8_9BACT|nr:MATE family efflux transporter [Melittangium boletus]ATB29009.1 MATE family efflux transporter [Melittangium boletus DSM 14713]